MAIQKTGWTHHWQDLARYVEQSQQFLVPVLCVQVEQHGARGIAHIGGMHPRATLTACELPQQPTVHRAKRQIALPCQGARARHMVEQPFEFGARKIRVDHQPGFVPHQLLQAARAKFGAQCFSAPVLPHDGVVQRLPRVPVPQHGGFTLVGDAYGRDVFRTQPSLRQSILGCGELAGPNLIGIMLHPAGLRKNLPELALCRGHRATLEVEHDGAGTGGALVQGEQVSGCLHGRHPCKRRHPIVGLVPGLRIGGIPGRRSSELAVRISPHELPTHS